MIAMKRTSYKPRHVTETKGVVFPPSMQRKIDQYKAKGWWVGLKAEQIFTAVNIPKLRDALAKTLYYANVSQCQVNITTHGSTYVIEVLENLPYDDRGDKFVKAGKAGVPNMLPIGKNLLFNYATAVGVSGAYFSVSDLQELIKLNS